MRFPTGRRKFTRDIGGTMTMKSRLLFSLHIRWNLARQIISEEQSLEILHDSIWEVVHLYS